MWYSYGTFGGAIRRYVWSHGGGSAWAAPRVPCLRSRAEAVAIAPRYCFHMSRKLGNHWFGARVGDPGGRGAIATSHNCVYTMCLSPAVPGRGAPRGWEMNELTRIRYSLCGRTMLFIAVQFPSPTQSAGGAACRGWGRGSLGSQVLLGSPPHAPRPLPAGPRPVVCLRMVTA